MKCMKIEYIDNHQTRILMAKLSPNKNYFTNMDHATAATDVDNNDTFLDCMILKFYKLDIEPCKSRANRYVILFYFLVFIFRNYI